MWKSAIVLEEGNDFSNFKVFDARFNSPFITDSPSKDENILLQYVDKIIIEENNFSYFTPNNVALHFSIASRSGIAAIDLLKRIKSRAKKKTHTDRYDRKALINDSKLVCEYLEQIQTSVVFSFTAIESFVNLSIPSEYTHEVKTKRKTEMYNKEQIERWITWKNKISKIMVDIYKANKIEDEKFWELFLMLVDLRNNIIHQKSTNETSYMEKLFEDNIFDVCQSANKVYAFFVDSALKRFGSNTEMIGREDLWPDIITYIPEMDLKVEKLP